MAHAVLYSGMPLVSDHCVCVSVSHGLMWALYLICSVSH